MHGSRGAARAGGGQGSGDRDGPRPKARWQEPLQPWGSAMCLRPWPSAGQSCPHRLQAQRGGTHGVIEMTALWTPRCKVGSSSGTLRERSLLSWHLPYMDVWAKISTEALSRAVSTSAGHTSYQNMDLPVSLWAALGSSAWSKPR